MRKGNEKNGEEYFKIPENAYDELPSELKENLKENKLQEKNDYFAYMDKDYAGILDSNVDVYDVKQFVLDDSNNEYRTQ